MFLFFNLTFAGWITFWIFIAASFVVCIYLAAEAEMGLQGFIISWFVCIALVCACEGGFSWYNTHTAAGQRAIKDNASNMSGGLDRKITIIYYGREDKPIEFEGKIDLKTTDDQKVLEFVMDGKKYIYYIGMLDRYIVEEK